MLIGKTYINLYYCFTILSDSLRSFFNACDKLYFFLLSLSHHPHHIWSYFLCSIKSSLVITPTLIVSPSSCSAMFFFSKAQSALLCPEFLVWNKNISSFAVHAPDFHLITRLNLSMPTWNFHLVTSARKAPNYSPYEYPLAVVEPSRAVPSSGRLYPLRVRVV